MSTNMLAESCKVDELSVNARCGTCLVCEARNMALEEAAKIVDAWLAAYPKDVFIEPPPGQHGISVDACSARAIRHATSRIAEEIRKVKGMNHSNGSTCIICFTSSFEPVENEKDCQLTHPHKGGHERCGYCYLAEELEHLDRKSVLLGKLIQAAIGDFAVAAKEAEGKINEIRRLLAAQPDTFNEDYPFIWDIPANDLPKKSEELWPSYPVSADVDNKDRVARNAKVSPVHKRQSNRT